MMALATIDDLADRGIDTCETVRMEALLADASAAVISYTGQDFERSARTLTVWPTHGFFELRGVDVDTVTAVDADDNTVTVEQTGTYRWYAGTSRKLVVTYTAGWATVPADIVAVTCSMVARAASVDPSQIGHSQDTAGPFSFTIGGAAANGAVGMMADERHILDRYRRTGGAIHAGNWAHI